MRASVVYTGMTDGKQHGAPESHWGTGERAQAAEALQREHVEIEPLDHDNARLLDQVNAQSSIASRDHCAITKWFRLGWFGGSGASAQLDTADTSASL